MTKLRDDARLAEEHFDDPAIECEMGQDPFHDDRLGVVTAHARRFTYMWPSSGASIVFQDGGKTTDAPATSDARRLRRVGLGKRDFMGAQRLRNLLTRHLELATARGHRSLVFEAAIGNAILTMGHRTWWPGKCSYRGMKTGKWPHPVAAALIALALVVAPAKRGHAEGEDTALLAERQKVCIADTFLSEGPPESWATLDAQAALDSALSDPRFYDVLARFLNSEFSKKTGYDPFRNVVYHLAKYVFEKDLPYHELFDGAYSVSLTDGSVQADPDAVGFWTARSKLDEFGGNEAEGLRLVEANHLLLYMTRYAQRPVSNQDPGGGESRLTRAECKGCHGDPDRGLELIARALPIRDLVDDNRFIEKPSKYPPQQVLGTTVTGRAQVVKALAASEDFVHAACAKSFKFLYGRIMNACEDATYQKCIVAFKGDGRLRSAISAIAREKEFCR